MAGSEIVTPIDRSFDCLATLNFGPYQDQFIAIIDGKVVGHNASEKDLVKDTRDQYPGKMPFIVKVPNRSEVNYI
ncbi:MAG: hypothetical protein KAH57_07070 [Thermoplasmata archaeon]|nr:hypothetical protein [Thermoplasmata archaeon]